MKEKDLHIEDKEHELILFAEKDDKSYDAVKTGSFMVKNYLDDHLMKRENLEKELRAELNKGKISPVYYYMVYQDMGIGDLAGRVGISKRKLRKHFNPEVFARLDPAALEKYAMIFGVTVEEMKSLGQKA
jgi:hypothetical protein